MYLPVLCLFLYLIFSVECRSRWRRRRHRCLMQEALAVQMASATRLPRRRPVLRAVPWHAVDVARRHRRCHRRCHH